MKDVMTKGTSIGWIGCPKTAAREPPAMVMG